MPKITGYPTDSFGFPVITPGIASPRSPSNALDVTQALSLGGRDRVTSRAILKFREIFRNAGIRFIVHRGWKQGKQSAGLARNMIVRQGA